MCSRNSEVHTIQSLQSKTFLSAPRYAISKTLHTALGNHLSNMKPEDLPRQPFSSTQQRPITLLFDESIGSRKL
jgi:hypothetical protein